MRGFVAEGDHYRAILEPAEARILVSLGEQLQQLYADGLAGDPLADQALTRVLPGHAAPSGAFNLVYPSARYLPQRTVAFRDFILEALGTAPPPPAA